MLLSIVVLSYNRPKQLQRIFHSLKYVQSVSVELIVKDDLSPDLPLIESLCLEWQAILRIPLRLHVNSCNLGYDNNLLSSFELVDSDFVFFLSDDDYIHPSGLLSALDAIATSSSNLFISPYIIRSRVLRTCNRNRDPSPLSNIVDVVYNSILFSGLIFRRSFVASLGLDREFLGSCIYTQVYLACCAAFSSTGYEFCPDPVVVVGGDGDNFFGLNQSAFDVSTLSNRNSPSADLRYHSYLLNVVKRFSFDYSVDCYSLFLLEYSKRLFGHILRSRARGYSDYRIFQHYLLTMNPPPSLWVRFFSFLVFTLPSSISGFFYKLLCDIFKRSG